MAAHALVSFENRQVFTIVRWAAARLNHCFALVEYISAYALRLLIENIIFNGAVLHIVLGIFRLFLVNLLALIGNHLGFKSIQKV